MPSTTSHHGIHRRLTTSPAREVSQYLQRKVEVLLTSVERPPWEQGDSAPPKKKPLVSSKATKRQQNQRRPGANGGPNKRERIRAMVAAGSGGHDWVITSENKNNLLASCRRCTLFVQQVHKPTVFARIEAHPCLGREQAVPEGAGVHPPTTWQTSAGLGYASTVLFSCGLLTRRSHKVYHSSAGHHANRREEEADNWHRSFQSSTVLVGSKRSSQPLFRLEQKTGSARNSCRPPERNLRHPSPLTSCSCSRAAGLGLKGGRQSTATQPAAC